MEILDKRQEALVERERILLESLVECMTGFGAPSSDVDLVRRGLAQVEGLFLLVVAGEFASGKSAFIDALVGTGIPGEDITHTTDRITVLKHGPEVTEGEQRGGVCEKTYPSDFLHGVSIVDTPVVNAIIGHNEEPSREYASRADLVLFVVSSQAPLTRIIHVHRPRPKTKPATVVDRDVPRRDASVPS